MIDLNSYAEKALNIAQKRHENEGLPIDEIGLIKHAAGELIETTAAWSDYFYDDEQHDYDHFSEEIADVITCMLILAASNKVDIEKALENCQLKNYRRACQTHKEG